MRNGGTLTATTTGKPRLTGIDVARLIAIAGMIMVHFGPNPVPDTTAGNVYDVTHGRASILFVLLAGVGISFLYQSARKHHWAIGRGQILIRAAMLLPIGLWLQTLDHGVLVILQYYAMYFLFAALVVGLSNRALLIVALGFIALGPVIYEAAETQWTDWFLEDAPELGDSPGRIARELIVSGYYPLVTWAAPLTLGMWIGRQSLSSNRVRLLIAGTGAALVVGTEIVARVGNSVSGELFGILLSIEPHSQTHLWIIGAIGSSLLLLGLALLMSDVAHRLLWPLAAAGQLALTIYVGHLLLLDRYTDILRHDNVQDAALSVGLFMLLAIAASTLWRTFFSHGPLEALFRVPSWIVNRNK